MDREKIHGVDMVTIIERINALRDRLYRDRLSRAESRELRRQVTYWRRYLAMLLASAPDRRRIAAV